MVFNISFFKSFSYVLHMARAYQWRIMNRDKCSQQRRREKVRRKLRDRGYLPPVGDIMDELQKKIYTDIGNGDFSFWDSVKLKGGNRRLHGGGKNHERITTIKKTNEQLILERVKQSAKERNLEFNLDINDIIIPEYCPLLDMKLTFIYSLESRDSYYSIDRIDSSRGYVKGNIQIMSLKANTMKNSATKEELVTFAQNILKQYF
jgi:hypothetical protein